MAATGASPIYYDFDMLEEMQVTTGGADVTQQTGGVGINLVTKSGTDRFKGNGRVLVTDEKFAGRQHHPRAARRRAPAPARRSRTSRTTASTSAARSSRARLWYWGSYGTQDIKVGVVGFYKNTPECRPNGQPLNSRTADTELLRSCLETDLTTLNNYNWKITCGAVQQQPLQLPEHLGGKGPQRARRRRPASDRDHLPPEGRRERVRHLRLADRPVAVLEGRRPARHQRPHGSST